MPLTLFKNLDIRQKRDGRIERRPQQKKESLNELDQLSKELEVSSYSVIILEMPECWIASGKRQGHGVRRNGASQTNVACLSRLSSTFRVFEVSRKFALVNDHRRQKRSAEIQVSFKHAGMKE